MERMEGMALSTGLVSGVAVKLSYELQRTFSSSNAGEADLITKTDVQAECERMDLALERSKRDLDAFATIASDKPSLTAAVEMLSAHMTMASEIAASVKQRVSSDLVGVENALVSVISQWASRLQQIDSEYLREHEMDVRDVGQRMMRHLLGVSPNSDVDVPVGAIVVARELIPSDAIALAESGAVGIVTEFGGTLGHTAIIARSLGIPAVSGISNVTERIASGVTLLVDGESGTVIADPTEIQFDEFTGRMNRLIDQADEKNVIDIGPCKTTDGTAISLLGNVGLLSDIDQVLRRGLSGVGLVRTEFLYLQSHVRPDATAQRIVYSQMADAIGDRPLTIRTFDLGGEKLPPFLSLDPHITPSSLHLRGLRFSLVERDLLREQLMAIVQVAQSADVRILFPMVIGGHDFAQAIAMVEEAVKECDGFRRPQIGAMIETPAALFCLDEILELADFVTIGTNDLTQYLLAADRELAAEKDPVTAMHPAVLRAIRQIVVTAERWDRPVCVCGEEASETEFAELLIGLGIRELSISPPRAIALRAAIGKIDLAVVGELARRALACRSPQEVRQLLAAADRSPFLNQGQHSSPPVPGASL
ncbi:phosphoenolpyruvate--protein phosphotransferase [Stieleria sp. TO1_6]|uniref:phosphoenolpyruvate--protein phosphotransferase n=1 Tax=Stieleria tagensis TaxID=2956795 RepID=UPI00209B8476|nr:phosphoenolpyruvate--protein phosphotransferase [Stieleria tagensis]MCO8122319.1 phosphoenolpyruvate--protein phosphotransferase [Stieleria tagensis]